jgi:ABC-type antimicrobial peptide transport system permease subunit
VSGDIRHALRRWSQRPGFAIAAIATLALGLGSTTALFSIVDGVLLRPLPWTDPDRLVAIHAVFPNRRQNPATALTWNRGSLSYPAWDALRLESAFADVGAWQRPPLDTTFGDARTDLVQTMVVSSRFLPMLGVRLVHGRFFSEAEDNANSDSMLITHEAWRRRFGGRPDIIGQLARIGHATSGDDEAKVIVGVIEPGFSFDSGSVPEVLLPVGIPAEASRRYPSASLRLVGRVSKDATFAAAALAADRVIRAVEQREPTSGRVVPLRDDMVRGAARPLFLLFGGAGLLLLIACANVAGLLLGEARSRRHEIAVRAVLGGSRARVLRQLIAEHSVLGVAGAAAGLALAYWMTELCVALAPAAIPRLDTVVLDARVIGFAVVLAGLTILAFGIAPAMTLARTPAARVLAEGGRDGASSRQLGQRAVVTTAIALALVLIVAASLFGETLVRLTSRPLGFDPSNLTVVSFKMTLLPNLPPPITKAEYDAQTPQQRHDRSQFFAHLWTIGWWQHLSGAFDRVASLPGVTGVAGAGESPFLSPRRSGTIRASGRPPQDAVSTRLQVVTDRYFETMRILILRGRTFESSDRIGIGAAGFFRQAGPPPASAIVISAELERRLFAGSGVGRQMVLGGPSDTGNERVLNVIGVVADTRWSKTDDDLAVFYVLAETFTSVNTVFVRTGDGAAASAPVMQATLREYNPNIVVTATAPLEDLVGRSMAEERFRAILAVMFGVTALGLAGVGLFGLAARRVADRRREIAVRVALGARPADVRGLVMLDTFRTIAFGLALGLPAAYAASQVTQTLLYGVTATSPRVFLVAGGVLALAAFSATVIPARRAATIDPIAALKE